MNLFTTPVRWGVLQLHFATHARKQQWFFVLSVYAKTFAIWYWNSSSLTELSTPLPPPPFHQQKYTSPSQHDPFTLPVLLGRPRVRVCVFKKNVKILVFPLSRGSDPVRGGRDRNLPPTSSSPVRASVFLKRPRGGPRVCSSATMPPAQCRVPGPAEIICRRRDSGRSLDGYPMFVPTFTRPVLFAARDGIVCGGGGDTWGDTFGRCDDGEYRPGKQANAKGVRRETGERMKSPRGAMPGERANSSTFAAETFGKRRRIGRS